MKESAEACGVVPCRHGRDDLVDTVVAPASAEAAATAVADVRDVRERVGKYLARLKEVRHKRSAMEVRVTENTIHHHALGGSSCVQLEAAASFLQPWLSEITQAAADLHLYNGVQCYGAPAGVSEAPVSTCQVGMP